jgi:hypothetical protein
MTSRFLRLMDIDFVLSLIDETVNRCFRLILIK